MSQNVGPGLGLGVRKAPPVPEVNVVFVSGSLHVSLLTHPKQLRMLAPHCETRCCSCGTKSAEPPRSLAQTFVQLTSYIRVHECGEQTVVPVSELGRVAQPRTAHVLHRVRARSRRDRAAQRCFEVKTCTRASP